MSEVQSLLLLLAAIYAVECLVWVPLGAVAFTIWIGRPRWRQPGLIAGNARGGFLMSHPLPPLGAIVYGQQLPLSLSPDGVGSWNPACLNDARRPPQRAQFMRWEDIREIATLGRKILVNDRLFIKASSESYALWLADWLRQVWKLPRERRSPAIGAWFTEQLDPERIAARWQDVQQRALPLRWLANGLFVSAFVLTPLAIWQFGLLRCVWFIVGAILAQTVSAAILYHRAQKALLPGAGEERFTWFLTMLLAAPTAMRAHDILMRRTVEHFHPLALAKVLCDAGPFQELARHVLRDLRFPIEPLAPGPAEMQAAVAWSQSAWRAAVEAFLHQTGFSIEEHLRAPARSEPGHLAYCPRCHAQFVVTEATCGDCGGRRLEKFENCA